eukprot:525182_1
MAVKTEVDLAVLLLHRFLLPFMDIQTVADLFAKFMPTNSVNYVLELFLRTLEDAGDVLPSAFIVALDNLDVLHIDDQIMMLNICNRVRHTFKFNHPNSLSPKLNTIGVGFMVATSDATPFYQLLKAGYRNRKGDFDFKFFQLSPLDWDAVEDFMHSRGSARALLEPCVRAAGLCGGHPALLVKFVKFLDEIPVDRLLDAEFIVSEFIRKEFVNFRLPSDTIRHLLLNRKVHYHKKPLPGADIRCSQYMSDGILQYSFDIDDIEHYLWDYNNDDQVPAHIAPIMLLAAAQNCADLDPWIHKMILCLTDPNRSFNVREFQSVHRAFLEMRFRSYYDGKKTATGTVFPCAGILADEECPCVIQNMLMGVAYIEYKKHDQYILPDSLLPVLPIYNAWTDEFVALLDSFGLEARVLDHNGHDITVFPRYISPFNGKGVILVRFANCVDGARE